MPIVRSVHGAIIAKEINVAVAIAVAAPIGPFIPWKHNKLPWLIMALGALHAFAQNSSGVSHR